MLAPKYAFFINDNIVDANSNLSREWPQHPGRWGWRVFNSSPPSLVPLKKFLNPRKFWKDLLYLLRTFVCFELSFKASSNFPLRATIFSQTFLNIGTTLRAKIYSSLQTVLKMMLRTCKVFEYIFKHDSFFTECFLL